jgi:hypothetical protein
VQVFLAAFRTQLRLSTRAFSTWGFLGLGVLLTAWGTLLDVLAVGVEPGRPSALAHATGVMGGILLGAWIGSGTPPRHSLRESRDLWAALPAAAWAIPAGRAAVAAALGTLGSILCVAYTLVLGNSKFEILGLLGGGGAALLAAAWAGFLAPRVGSLAAIVGVVALAALAFTPVPTAIRPFLPTALASVPIRGVSLLACLLGSVGLLALTPLRARADVKAGLER